MHILIAVVVVDTAACSRMMVRGGKKDRLYDAVEEIAISLGINSFAL